MIMYGNIYIGVAFVMYVPNMYKKHYLQIKMWNDNTLPLLCGGQITLSKIDEIWTLAIPNQISTISMHKSSLVRIYRKWKHVCVVGWHQNFMKFAQTWSPQCQCTHQVWVKSIDIYSSYHLNTKIGDVWREDNSVKKLMKCAHLQSQTRLSQYQCTYQIWWKSIDIYSNYHPEMKTQTDGQQTDGHMNIQHQTIIPCHCCVLGYKKRHQLTKNSLLLYQRGCSERKVFTSPKTGAILLSLLEIIL